MNARHLLLLVSLVSSVAYANLDSGRFTSFDRFGLPEVDRTTPLQIAYTDFEAKAKRGGHLRLSTVLPMELIHPNYYQKGMQKQILPIADNFIFESLMNARRQGPERTLYANLAKAVRVDASTLTYVIELRDDVKFSDGSLLTSQDVVNTYTFWMTEVNGPATQPWYDANWGKVDLQVLSNGELQVRFPDISPKKQREALWNFLGLTIIKQSATANPAITIPQTALGTGAYAVQEAHRDRVVLARRPDYWNQQTALYNFDKITMATYRDSSVTREAFKKNDLDYFVEIDISKEPVIDSGLERGKYKKSLVPIIESEILTTVFHFNTANKHLRDLRVRKAITLAMDLETTNRNLYSNRMPALAMPGANSPLSPKGTPTPEVAAILQEETQLPDALKPVEEMGFKALGKEKDMRVRFREATQLLREAGYQIVNRNMVKDGEAIELTALIRVDSPSQKALELLKANLVRIGIQLNIRVVPDVSAMIADLNAQAYDIFPQPIPIPRSFDVLDADHAEQRFSSKYSRAKNPGVVHLNLSNINLPTLDKVLTELGETDPTAPRYRVLVDALQRLVFAHVPFLPIGERIDATVYTARGLCHPPLIGLDRSIKMLPAAYFSEDCGDSK